MKTLAQIKFKLVYSTGDSSIHTIAREINPENSSGVWKELLLELLIRMNAIIVKKKNQLNLDKVSSIELVSVVPIQALDIKRKIKHAKTK